MSVTRFLIMVLALLVSGCSLLAPPPAVAKKEVLAKVPLEIPRRDATEKLLLISAPEAEPLFDTTKMAYSTKAYEVGYFADHEWAEKPAQMIQSLLLTTLRRTGYFHQITLPPDFSRHDYLLTTRLLALTQDHTAEPPLLRASMRVQLRNAVTNQTIAETEFSKSEVIAGGDPYEGVVAANEAVAAILKEVARFVIENVERNGR